MTAKERKYDVTSAEPVLFYAGPGSLPGVPAADLSANDLARIARESTDKAIDALRDELVATGTYTVKKESPE